MWNEDFYPTPKELALKLFNGCKTDIFSKTQMILEPSAGKGDLIDAYAEAYRIKNTKDIKLSNNNWHYEPSTESIETYCKSHIHCVEIEPELSGILKSKGYTIVGTDFLTFETSTKYTFIMMNPPFFNAHKHLQKAWEILDDGGEIACILPSNFLNNHSKYQNIFSEYGEIISLGNFNDYDDIFRKANVEVSAFYLRKPAKENKFSFYGNYDKDEEIKFTGTEKFQSELALRDVIGNYVTMYNKTLEAFVKTADLMSEYFHYIRPFSNRINESGGIDDKEFIIQNLVDLAKSYDDTNKQRYAYNNFVTNLKEVAWKKIFSMTGVNNLLTNKIKDEFIKFQREQSNLSFSKENIEEFLRNLYLSQKDIKEQCVVDAFDILTSFDKRNKIHVEGWKTNSFYKVNKKVIVPFGLREEGWFSTPTVNSYKYENLVDIDKALCFLDSKKYENIKSIVDTIQNAKEWNTVYESEFFYIRCYKKGTIHLTFKNLDLLATFNRVAVKDKWNLVGYEE